MAGAFGAGGSAGFTGGCTAIGGEIGPPEASGGRKGAIAFAGTGGVVASAASPCVSAGRAAAGRGTEGTCGIGGTEATGGRKKAGRGADGACGAAGAGATGAAAAGVTGGTGAGGVTAGAGGGAALAAGGGVTTGGSGASACDSSS